MSARPTKVRVLARHVRAGTGGDCFRCAVALAMAEATGDDHANVYEFDFQVHLEVHGRSVLAPAAVRQFVWAFDDIDRDEHGRPRHPDGLRPFTFELPPDGSPEWQERCGHCDEPTDPRELSDDGVCPECRGGGER